MMLIGLTGGTGSGKSTFAGYLAERGIPVIDADKIGHEVLAPGTAGEAAVLEAFGPEILTANHLDRAKLGAKVFRDSKSLQQLNAIVQPRIAAAMMERCAALAQSGAQAIVIDAALLGDSGARDPWLSHLILVRADAAIRKARIMARAQLNADEAEARIKAQVDPDSKIPYSDWVVENESDLAFLEAEAQRIAEAIAHAAKQP